MRGRRQRPAPVGLGARVSSSPTPGATPEALRAAGSGQIAQKASLVLVSGLLYSLSIASVSLAARDLSPLALSVMRLAVASVVLGVILAVVRPSFSWRPRRVAEIFFVGLANVGLPFVLLALSLRFISSSLAAILFNLGPPITLIMAHFTLKDERLTRGKMLGMVLAVAGAVLLVGSNASGRTAASDQAWIGQLCIIVASILGAVALVYTRRHLRNEHTLVLSAGQVFASLAVLAPALLIVGGFPAPGDVSRQTWAAVFAAGVFGPVIAFWLLFYMVNRYSASLGGLSSIATPLFSVAIGILFLGEIMTLPIAVGTLLLLAGIWTVNSA